MDIHLTKESGTEPVAYTNCALGTCTILENDNVKTKGKQTYD